MRRNLKVGCREFQDFRRRVGSFPAEKSQNAFGEDGRELVAALIGRQIRLRIIWQIGRRFGRDVAETKE